MGTDTDLLMLVALSATDLNTYLHVMSSAQSNGHRQYNKNSHTQAILAGSSMFRWGATKFLHLTCTGRKRLWWFWKLNHSYMEAFTKDTSTHDEVARAGEVFILKRYGARQQTYLDNYRFSIYKLINKTLLSTRFTLETLPPNSTASQYHVSHTIEQWLGNEISACAWCWQDKVVTGSCGDWQSSCTR